MELTALINGWVSVLTLLSIDINVYKYLEFCIIFLLRPNMFRGDLLWVLPENKWSQYIWQVPYQGFWFS